MTLSRTSWDMRRKVVLETSCDDGPDLSSLPSTTLRLPDILLMPASRKILHHGNEEASSRGDYSRNSEPSFFILYYTFYHYCRFSSSSDDPVL